VGSEVWTSGVYVCHSLSSTACRSQVLIIASVEISRWCARNRSQIKGQKTDNADLGQSTSADGEQAYVYKSLSGGAGKWPERPRSVRKSRRLPCAGLHRIVHYPTQEVIKNKVPTAQNIGSALPETSAACCTDSQSAADAGKGAAVRSSSAPRVPSH